MSQFITWLATCNKHPVYIAMEAHYQLVTIHPFIDGNGRVARLLMNLILLQNGYPPAIIQIKERTAYINSLEKAQLGGSKDDFELIIIKEVNHSLDYYLKILKNEYLIQDVEPHLLKIGHLAKLYHESIATIRHWTEKSIISYAEKTPSGYYLYEQRTLERIKKIQELKKQRYRLDEIKELLEQAGDNEIVKI